MKCLRWWSLGLLSVLGSLAALDCLWADSPSAGSGDSSSAPPTAKRDREDETNRVAKLLESVIQPRFLQDAGEFGVRRLITVNGHEPVTFHAETKSEKKVLDQVNASGRDYFIAFLHMAHKPGRYVRPQPGGAPPVDVKLHLSRIPTERDSRRTERQQLSSAQWALLLKTATGDLPQLREGKGTTAPRPRSRIGA